MKKIFLAITLISLFSTLQGDMGDTSCCDCGSFEIGADWLYWKAFQDNLEYGADVNTVSTSNTVINSKPLSPDFNVNSGFRVFGNYAFCDNSWQIGGIFTRLSSSAGDSVSNDPANIANHFIVVNSQSFPILTVLNSNNIQFSSLASSWTSKVNYFDLDICRTICLCSCFEISPHMGLRGMWLKQKLHLNGISPSGDGGSFFSDFNQKYDGYGLEGGLHACLQLGCGFSLTGHLGGSLLYSRIALDESISVTTGGSNLIIGVNETVYHLSPTIDGFIGMEYHGSCFCYPFNLHVGWEQHIIINSNHFGVFNYADLTLQGLTLGGSITF